MAVVVLRQEQGVTVPYYVYADHLHTPRVITRASDNAMVWRWDQADPFGAAQPEQSPVGLVAFVYNPRFPGQVYDAESGFYYNYFRDYDPGTARYLQSDPIGLNGGLNTYTYVNGNPLNFTDPLGLECTAQNGRVTCNVPGGPQINFPQPNGWPKSIKPGDSNYHYYNKWVNAGKADPNCLQKYLQDHPTPGSPKTATPAGTPNDASPPWAAWATSSPVRSYSMTSNGMQVVVNVTMPNHPLFPGYVARTVAPGGSGNIVNNFGEGVGWAQNPNMPGSNLLVNNVWYGLTQKAIEACSCSK